MKRGEECFYGCCWFYHFNNADENVSESQNARDFLRSLPKPLKEMKEDLVNVNEEYDAGHKDVATALAILKELNATFDIKSDKLVEDESNVE